MFRIRTAGAFAEPAALGEPPRLNPAPGIGPQIEFHRGRPTAGPFHVQTRPKRRDPVHQHRRRRPRATSLSKRSQNGDLRITLTYTAIFSLSLQRAAQACASPRLRYVAPRNPMRLPHLLLLGALACAAAIAQPVDFTPAPARPVVPFVKLETGFAPMAAIDRSDWPTALVKGKSVRAEDRNTYAFLAGDTFAPGHVAVTQLEITNWSTQYTDCD